MRRLPLTLGSRRINFFSSARNGLGNQILPMGCTIHLAKELNYRPVVFWLRSGIRDGAKFGDLFDTANLPFELVEGIEAKAMRVAIDGRLLGSNFLEKRFSGYCVVRIE